MLLSNVLAFIGNLGTGEMVVLVLIVLLLFGAKRIPDLARGLGKGIREFKDATKEIKHDIENAANDDRPHNTANRNQGGPYNPNPNTNGYNQPQGYNNPNNAPYNNNEPVVNPTTPHNPNV
ncbi:MULTISPECIES: Sec-independent protein translocase subunit TatA/TatB [Rufibacter]|uniref:Sec-independent protein translocase protein TatA n=1 Tax=Rufibacter quisquiliarum TaxID=1549639 RepID=A0A839GFZ8_9BACT|nr:TatA/E family protein of Tat protein translocase [Rufibacter quisquiliarum]